MVGQLQQASQYHRHELLSASSARSIRCLALPLSSVKAGATISEVLIQLANAATGRVDPLAR